MGGKGRRKRKPGKGGGGGGVRYNDGRDRKHSSCVFVLFGLKIGSDVWC